MNHTHLDLVDRNSAVYAQGRQDALRGQPRRTDDDVFGGYYLDYKAGYDDERQREQPRKERGK